MKKVGLIVAVEQEVMREALGNGEQTVDEFETTIYKYKGCMIYAVSSGAGEVFAAAATQHLIDFYKVEIVFNYGVVGGCCPTAIGGELRTVESVVHYTYDISEVDGVPPGRYLEYPSEYIVPYGASTRFTNKLFGLIKTAVCASGDRFVGDPKEKAMLYQKYGAEICDMEAAGIILTCNKNRMPCVLLKCVADTATGGGEEYWTKKRESSRACFRELLKAFTILCRG